AIRSKSRLWRAMMRPRAAKHENFFVAKICDSDSVRRPLRSQSRLASLACARFARHERMKETTAAQALPALLTFVDADLSGTFRIVSRKDRCVVNQSAPCTR